LLVRFQPLFGDLLFYVSWDTYLLVAFSAGYFLYDLYDIYANGYLKREWVVGLHHVIVLISFSYHMCQLMSVGYTVLALMMEFNSVFLHARKLLGFYMFGKRSAPYLVNCACNILTFVLFRFGILVYIFYGVYLDGHRVTWSYLTMLVTCVSLMAIINVVLFKRIVEKDVVPLVCGAKRITKKKQQQQIDDDNDANCTSQTKEQLMNEQPIYLNADNLPIINNNDTSNVVNKLLLLRKNE
jgi:hypothetical protein